MILFIFNFLLICKCCPVCNIAEMSRTECSRKCRTKIYEDKQKHEDHKTLQREKKKEYRERVKQKMTPKKIEEKRIKERLAKRKQRLRKKAKALQAGHSSTGYRSRQSLGKAVKKAEKSLPHSPTKTVSVLITIIGKLTPTKKAKQLNSTFPQKQKRQTLECNQYKRKRSDALSESDIKSVHKFYARDDISRTCPGKKESKAIR